jgi:hypothetical protein
MYTLKLIARRGTALGAAFALLVAAVVPAAPAFADALNPLTERSLLLSSSAPGYVDTDGSGNPTYAPPGSGPNGKKTGETFTFKVSSTASISGMSLQYCTTAAGHCKGPGNNTGDADPNDDGSTADSTRLLNETPTTGGWALNKSDLNVVGTFVNDGDATPEAGEFVVLVNGVASTGWTMAGLRAESEDAGVEDLALSGKNNMMHLTRSSGQALTAGDQIQVIFEPSSSIYITNPGADEFFVKINTYDTNTTSLFIPTVPYSSNTNIVDGGVTVANVMTDSIHITTKVLETMSFSVGTENRDTVELAGAGFHGSCDAILQTNNNRLNLGNPSAEYSLETGRGYDVYSYWRLSSNSSGGASVYYSGNTLANTVGDEIAEMPNEVESTPGTEQFGLGFVDAGLDTRATGGDDTWSTDYINSRSYPFITVKTQTGAPYDTLDPQLASDPYDEATGTLFTAGSPNGPGTAKFKFLKSSLTTPELIAQQDDDVISCATAKMRYVGNIAADTPAGVYTTKINYLAAPQY